MSSGAPGISHDGSVQARGSVGARASESSSWRSRGPRNEAVECPRLAAGRLNPAHRRVRTPRGRRVHEALVRNEEPTLRSPLESVQTGGGAPRRFSRRRPKDRAPIAADARGLPDSSLLFVNVHPEDLNDFDLSSPASPLSAIATRVVLELTERASLDGVAGLQSRIGKLRELGFRVAIDDLGAGYAGLSSFTLLQPDYVKLDASSIRSIDTSHQKRSIVRAMMRLRPAI